MWREYIIVIGNVYDKVPLESLKLVVDLFELVTLCVNKISVGKFLAAMIHFCCT